MADHVGYHYTKVSCVAADVGPSSTAKGTGYLHPAESVRTERDAVPP